MTSFEQSIRASNREGRHAWERFESHRRQVMQLLLSCAQPDASLCILGAGNLNDVDLRTLCSAYRDVHLVDIDVDSVHLGLARQGHTGSRQVRVHPPVDLTGILGRLPTRRLEPSPALREQLGEHSFGVTASTGVLTQLLQSVVESGLSPTDTVEVSLAVRDKHLLDLVELTRPGGRLVLVTDVVATTTAPELLHALPGELEPRMAALVADGNFFTGVNPYRIVAVLEEDVRFAGLVSDVVMVGPWLWAVTPDRQHLTCAITAVRTG